MSIQLQNAARVINDATAEEENVQKGKVFYNNSGRHVGVAEIEVSTPYNVNVTKLDTKMTHVPLRSFILIRPQRPLTFERHHITMIKLQWNIIV